MKRFITYLYEYEKGQKTKNTGFIRVDERNGKVIFQISVRNFIRSHEKGEIYAFIWENGLHRIEIGKLTILNNQTDVRLELDADDFGDSGYGLDRVIGIGMVFPNSGYMASCWDDAYAETIGSGRFCEWGNSSNLQAVDSREPQEVVKHVVGPSIEPEPQMTEVKPGEANVPQDTLLEAASYDLVVYQKMELNAIRNLPSPNWYLCNNRFLVHGFFNYGYLILKKTTEADGEKVYLGVPGIYEKPEMVMATLFGFPEFETLPKEIQEAKMGEMISVPGNSQGTETKSSVVRAEKSEPRQGNFGCWLIPIQG